MSKEIKSVRLRPRNANANERLLVSSGSKGAQSDVKVTIYDESGVFGGDKYQVGLFLADRPDPGGPDKRHQLILYDYRKKDQYKDFTPDDFIKDAILQYSKQKVNQRGKGENAETFYEIVQDPWSDDVPKRRSYGFDKYVLNNESSILIKWFNGNSLEGGFKWSNDDGSEREIEKGKTQSDKGFITKKIEIFGGEVKKLGLVNGKYRVKEVTDPKDIFTYTKNNEFSKTGDPYEWSGIVKDTDIIEQILSYWKKKVVGYDSIGMCVYPQRTFDYFCDKIEYVSPLQPEVLPGPVISEPTGLSGPSGPSGNTGGSASKIKMNISFPKEFKVMAREDVPDFQIYIGEPPVEEPVEGFVFSDDEMTGLDPEYTEAGFEGIEEPIFDNNSLIEKQGYDSPQDEADVKKEADKVNSQSLQSVQTGKHKFDNIPGEFVTNSKSKIKCVQIGGKPVNINIANALLDMMESAKKSGITLGINSGFRPGFDPSIKTKSEGGVSVSAQSQDELYRAYLAAKAAKKKPADTAKPGNSRHGNGLAIDFNTGTRTGVSNIGPMGPDGEKRYIWLVKNGWKFGFIRGVGSEEWHFEYLPDKAKNGPYAGVGAGNALWYADLGLKGLQGPNWGSEFA